MRVVGIDPGKSGAIALLDDRQFVEVVDMPTRAKFDNNDKQQVDGYVLADLLSRWKPDIIAIEKVHATPTYGGPPKFCPSCKRPKNLMGAPSAFAFGDNFGVLKGVVMSLRSLNSEGFELKLVTPSVWKRAASLERKSKEDSREQAIRMFPNAAPRLTRKKDDGRAEALLIGFYAGFPEVTVIPHGTPRKKVARQMSLMGE